MKIIKISYMRFLHNDLIALQSTFFGPFFSSASDLTLHVKLSNHRAMAHGPSGCPSSDQGEKRESEQVRMLKWYSE